MDARYLDQCIVRRKRNKYRSQLIHKSCTNRKFHCWRLEGSEYLRQLHQKKQRQTLRQIHWDHEEFETYGLAFEEDISNRFCDLYYSSESAEDDDYPCCSCQYPNNENLTSCSQCGGSASEGVGDLRSIPIQLIATPSSKTSKHRGKSRMSNTMPLCTYSDSTASPPRSPKSICPGNTSSDSMVSTMSDDQPDTQKNQRTNLHLVTLRAKEKVVSISTPLIQRLFHSIVHSRGVTVEGLNVQCLLDDLWMRRLAHFEASDLSNRLVFTIGNPAVPKIWHSHHILRIGGLSQFVSAFLRQSAASIIHVPSDVVAVCRSYCGETHEFLPDALIGRNSLFGGWSSKRSWTRDINTAKKWLLDKVGEDPWAYKSAHSLCLSVVVDADIPIDDGKKSGHILNTGFVPIFSIETMDYIHWNQKAASRWKEWTDRFDASFISLKKWLDSPVAASLRKKKQKNARKKQRQRERRRRRALEEDRRRIERLRSRQWQREMGVNLFNFKKSTPDDRKRVKLRRYQDWEKSVFVQRAMRDEPIFRSVFDICFDRGDGKVDKIGFMRGLSRIWGEWWSNADGVKLFNVINVRYCSHISRDDWMLFCSTFFESLNIRRLQGEMLDAARRYTGIH